jgi:hypothetical protein
MSHCARTTTAPSSPPSWLAAATPWLAAQTRAGGRAAAARLAMLDAVAVALQHGATAGTYRDLRAATPTHHAA